MSGRFVPIDLAVVGAGISGLATAFWAKRRGRSVVLFEASSHVGGCITTVRNGGCIADGGPQTFAAAPLFEQLADEAGLRSYLMEPAPEAARPLLYHRGRLVPVPGSPKEALQTSLLSVPAKLRALAEPLAAGTRSDDESVASFVRRKFGSAVLEAVVQPYVGGIFAGDPERLSVASAFPALARMEKESGSVLRAAFLRARAARRTSSGRAAGTKRESLDRKRRMFAFRGGNDVLPRALAGYLGTDLRLETPVRAIWQRGEWMELFVGKSSQDRVVARDIVLATPAKAAAQLLDPLEPKAADLLSSIDYPPVVQIAMTYPRAAVGAPLRGFGFLASRGQGLKILGCVWNSAMFADRCSSDDALVTAFLGGALDPSVSTLTDEQLARQAHEDLQKALKTVDKPPRVVAGFRWQEAIPQYTIGHAARLAGIEEYLRRLPHVRLSGSYLCGPSVADCLASAERALEPTTSSGREA